MHHVISKLIWHHNQLQRSQISLLEVNLKRITLKPTQTCCGQSGGRHNSMFAHALHVHHQQKHLILLNHDAFTGPKNI